ncbi:MAG TPA: YdjY domain-containing protein [Thermoanaerobaculia bacterium]|jgi:hypothetical protein
MRLTAAALLLLLAAGAAYAATPTADKTRREVRFTATVQPTAMDRPFGVKGHHAIVWKGGRARTWALFVADVSDHDVRLALDSIGAKRGENLTPDSWNKRDDPHSREPDKRVVGTLIDVLVEWQGSGGRIPLRRLLAEEGKPSPQLDFRYGGNEAYQQEFKSGCIVCLYSCPGGAIGNHAHPIRDYVRDGAVYESVPERLPKPGTKVTITLKVGR